MNRLLNAAVTVLCVVAVAEIAVSWTASRAPHPATLLDHVRDYIDHQYHDCIPLGWYPQRLPHGGYYPAVNLDVANVSGPFQALWVGIVPRVVRDARVREVKLVLDQLLIEGLLTRTDDPRGVRYNVTKYGQRFFFEDAEATGNVEAWPYACYSRLRVARLEWDTARPAVIGEGRQVARYVRVWWSTAPDGDWVTPWLRAHSTQLLPATNPAETVVCRYIDGEWSIAPFATDTRAEATRAAATPAGRRSGDGTRPAKPRSWAPC